MFYAGCNLLLQPFLLDSPLYGDIPAFGGLDLCCGEPLYRMGCWDAARAAAVHVKEEFDRMGIERIIVTCLAGYHMFRHVYPSVFGVTLNCEVVAIEEWLHDRIARGEIAITPLHKRVAIHDNCWPKASGDALFDKVRALLELLGVEVVEPAHTRETALCCGMCAGAARFKLRDILKAAKERIRELERTDADYVINYCGGCNWLFGVANRLSRPKARKPWYHLLELVQMAAGETPKHRTDRRARGIVSSMALPVLLHRLSPRRFRITEIGGRSVDEVDGSASRPASERELE
jgi:Fe-S oxidoreductase